jgi:hypothetical protein
VLHGTQSTTNPCPGLIFKKNVSEPPRGRPVRESGIASAMTGGRRILQNSWTAAAFITRRLKISLKIIGQRFEEKKFR